MKKLLTIALLIIVSSAFCQSQDSTKRDIAPTVVMYSGAVITGIVGYNISKLPVIDQESHKNGNKTFTILTCTVTAIATTMLVDYLIHNHKVKKLHKKEQTKTMMTRFAEYTYYEDPCQY